jgi:hypothetical protein
MSQQQDDKALIIINRKVNKALFYHVFWTICPFIGGAFMLIVTSKYSSIISMVDKGDFFLFSTAFFASSYFLYNENAELVNKRKDSILSALCFPLIFIIAFIYSVVFLHSLEPQSVQQQDINNLGDGINFTFLRVSSIVLVIVSIYAFYRSLKLDYKKFTPKTDAKQEETIEVKNIMDDLGDNEEETTSETIHNI